MDDDMNIMPDGGNEQAVVADQGSEVPVDASTKAPLRQHQTNRARVLAPDSTLEVRNAEIAQWASEYGTMMRVALRQKAATAYSYTAKKNAENWVLRLGRIDGADGPLDVFRSIQILGTLSSIKLPHGSKRVRNESEEPEPEAGRKRGRTQEPFDEMDLGFDDGAFPVMNEDTGIEVGREAQTPLDEHRRSSMMPWNRSAGSHRPTAVPSSSIKSGPGATRRGSRLHSTSPLIGSGMHGGDINMQGLSLNDEAELGDIGPSELDNFELQGPADDADMSSAPQLPWQRPDLDEEGSNFLRFVQDGIDHQPQASIDFESLIPARDHTRMVAAQALMNVLTLGSKNLISVKQTDVFGPITISLVA
ncbi:hypothetical protein K470DRAFT_260645 [Piedraia hortae CBS 480.64]|uniref:Rad21/Rec8-like protein C-terminal eukaryotic domain-containing protein n=1 Tax=Piedraia hortae CBS 480.64 TaxID=1314780 RepID=A0A6A7BQR5_9PEZI|nr:hypothetical protein K470DRAFT_260645 [Piedraia hortae CBS 480.64]